jgi:AAA+ ATPase superfamily predicted ATPase
MTAQLELSKFNMKNISFKPNENKGPVIVLIGRRDTGKSFLVRDLLYHHQDIPVGTVISGTEAGNGFYSKYVPKLFIHDEYNTIIIENILKRQKAVLKQINKEIKNYNKTTIDPRTFVILDDCLYDNGWARDKMMRLLFMNGRHWKLMLIITMQYPLGIPPNLRTNIDYVFILREPYIANRKRIYENYAGMFPTFESFVQIMDQCTENYECLVINNNSKSNNLQDQIFWYKAEKHENFRLGSKEFWELSEQLNSDDEDIDNYNPTKSTKRKGPKINVKKSKW